MKKIGSNSWAAVTELQAEISVLRDENSLFQQEIEKLRRENKSLKSRIEKIEKNHFEICNDCISQ